MQKILILISLFFFISCQSSKQHSEIPKIWLGIVNYDSGWIKERGEYNSNYKPHRARIGVWEEFYEKLKIKAKGKYESDFFVQCCIGGPCDMYYSYKVGEWVYYHTNGQIKAKGVFRIRRKKIETSCEGGDYIKAGVVTDAWVFFDENGNKTSPNQEFIREIEESSFIIDWGT
ncbi:hypothetical protein SB49_12640 [Sediminicola sp. YIK13]|uniref:hypothetical protein n=1 Tax=Sediminicola sp. YIK13 TaxID=1453352 RepID=UPI00071F9184|nr:hypothetical protein [Sediminicola sp. YIK13]ALM08558.1 hypothetical protein SB49_12640 [Sediminicola sp. YIK13]